MSVLATEVNKIIKAFKYKNVYSLQIAFEHLHSKYYGIDIRLVNLSR